MPAATASSPAACTRRAWARFACSGCTTRGCCDGGRRGRAALVRAPLQPRGRLSRGDGGGVGVAAARAPACGGGAGGHRLAAVPGRARRRATQPRAHPAGGAGARARRARGRGLPPLRHLLRRPDHDQSPRRPRGAGGGHRGDGGAREGGGRRPRARRADRAPRQLGAGRPDARAGRRAPDARRRRRRGRSRRRALPARRRGAGALRHAHGPDRVALAGARAAARPARRAPGRTQAVAVVAAGVATPLGLDLDTFWSALCTGVDGISAIERFRVDDLRVGRGGEIKKLRTLRHGRLPRCRASALLLLAADDLLARAALTADPARVAVVVGTALGGVEEGERALGEGGVRAAAGGLYDSPAQALAERLAARGPVLTVSTACASGATAMGVGADLLAANAADLVVAGGYDVLCRFVMRGFDALRSLTRERVRPFDRRRSGLLLGEGAALVLLARDADAPRVRLGRLLASRDGVVPGTAGYEEADPACELDVRGVARAARPRVSLSTSLGFGGCNAALVLEGTS